jgi:hypothetical protein
VKKIGIVFALCFLGFISPVRAELSQKVRDNFSDIEKDYCNSRISYSLSDVLGTREDGWSDEGKANEFHTTVDCLFDSALEEVTEKQKGFVQSAFSAVDLPIRTFSLPGACQPNFLAVVQGEQEAKGFVSRCVQSEIPEISQSFSACRVAETVLQEWCGYDLFLYSKIQDEESFYKLQPSRFSKNEMVDNFRIEQRRLERERREVEKAVMDSIQLYQETEYAYRQSTWLVALREELRVIQGDWAKLRSALGTFVDKFVNASIAP